MITPERRSALLLAFGLVVGLMAGFAAPVHAAADELNSPVFVAPPANAAQSNTASQSNTFSQPAPENQAAPSDQLNDADRALRDNAAAQSNTAEPPATRSTPVMAASGEHSVWDETSLIGKIFIGFGALLTIASAARMFMA